MKKLLLSLILLLSSVASATLYFPITGIVPTGGGGGGDTYATVSAAWAAEPYLSGTKHYYCDCGTGAEGDCVAGSDSNDGLSTSAPKQTIASAASLFSSLSANDSVLLCKGGAFNVGTSLNIGSTGRCSAGTPCNDLREYSPTTFTGTAKPILNWSSSGFLFDFEADGGVRILNLSWKGTDTAGRYGVFIYDSAADVTIGGNDIDAFDMSIYDESNAGNNDNIIMTGNHITNTISLGFLGSSSNSHLSYNLWEDNGSSNDLDHTVYLGSAGEVQNFYLEGNEISGAYGGGTCAGAPVEGHFSVDGFYVRNNTITIADADWGAACFGMEFNNETDATDPIYHRNTIISGNTIINGGNTALNVTGCSSCTIENNVIVFTATPSDQIHYGIRIPIAAHKAGNGDDTNSGTVIRNNTIYYGTGYQYSATGIYVGLEGTGYIISNNSVTFATSSGSYNCFSYDLTASSYSAYTFIDNNHCYSAATYNWEAGTSDSLTAWRAATTFDDNSITSAPVFVNAPTDFTPDTGSPLIGAGSNTYKSTTDFIGTARPNPPAIGAYEP